MRLELCDAFRAEQPIAGMGAEHGHRPRRSSRRASAWRRPIAVRAPVAYAPGMSAKRMRNVAGYRLRLECVDAVRRERRPLPGATVAVLEGCADRHRGRVGRRRGRPAVPRHTLDEELFFKGADAGSDLRATPVGANTRIGEQCGCGSGGLGHERSCRRGTTQGGRGWTPASATVSRDCEVTRCRWRGQKWTASMNERSGPADGVHPTCRPDDGRDVRSVLLYPGVVFPRTERTEGERRV